VGFLLSEKICNKKSLKVIARFHFLRPKLRWTKFRVLCCLPISHWEELKLRIPFVLYSVFRCQQFAA